MESGLKNSQGGLDVNPYGEVRVCGRDRNLIKNLLNEMKGQLSEEDKLSPQTHEIVRVCKRRGMAMSLYGLFKTNSSKLQEAQEELTSTKATL